VQQFFSPYLVSVLLYREGETESHHNADLASTISLLPTAYLEELDLNRLSFSNIHPVLSEAVQQSSAYFKVLVTKSTLSDPAWEYLTSPKTGIIFLIPHLPRS
jgi:hypothetical protein